MMNFTVDKENKTVHVEREFSAPIENVWAAWTESELLDQWWAPKPYKTKTKTMDFREGGHWLYAMIGPTGDTHWCRADYKSIDVQKKLSWLDAFCDESGNINQEFPRALWKNIFSEQKENTVVSIRIEYKELADLERIIALGFKEGFTAAMKNLDLYLSTQSAK